MTPNRTELFSLNGDYVLCSSAWIFLLPIGLKIHNKCGFIVGFHFRSCWFFTMSHPRDEVAKKYSRKRKRIKNNWSLADDSCFDFLHNIIILYVSSVSFPSHSATFNSFPFISLRICLLKLTILLNCFMPLASAPTQLFLSLSLQGGFLSYSEPFLFRVPTLHHVSCFIHNHTWNTVLPGFMVILTDKLFLL